MVPQNAKNAESPYRVLRPLMAKFGATCSPEEFYWAVNKAYHAAESACYDVVHKDMYEEEEMVWKTLLKMLPSSPDKLSMLDIGCGTGLVGHFIAAERPSRVKALHLLDPSSEMLEIARTKAKDWPFETKSHQGEVFSLPGEASFDVVTINSVLHHVVELEPFLRHVSSLLRPGGLLLTAHDPREGGEDDLTFSERRTRVSAAEDQERNPLRKLRRLIANPLKKLLGIERHDPLTMATNKPLLESKVIAKVMDNRAIWAVTDFHVPNQPGSFGCGIDADKIASFMPDMRLSATLTYHYHGVSWSFLSDAEKSQEKQWWEERDAHGAELALAWLKKD